MAQFSLEHRVTLGTDGANFLLYHPDDFTQRPGRPGECLSHDFAWKKETAAGRIVAFGTGSDGGFAFRITSSGPTKREKRYQACSAQFAYTVRHGRVMLDNGCGYDRFWFDVPNGQYRVAVHALDWSEEPGADDREPEENLPNYVIVFEPIRNLASVKPLPCAPRLDGYLGAKVRPAYERTEFRQAQKPLKKKTYLLLVHPGALLLPNAHLSLDVSDEVNELIWKNCDEAVVIAPSETVPTTATLAIPTGGGRVNDGPFHIGFQGQRLVTVTGHLQRAGQRLAKVEPFVCPNEVPKPKDVAALKAAFARFAQDTPRRIKIDDLEFTLESVEAMESAEELVWWLLKVLPVSAEERMKIVLISLAKQVRALTDWLGPKGGSSKVKAIPVARQATAREDNGFLQTIIENPEDDAPRLVYADWLEEQGDPRGQFIRLQCQLAQLEEDDPKYAVVDKQADALLDQFRKDWQQPLEALGCSGQFYRGFVSRAGMTVDDFLKNGERTFQLAPIRVLRLSLDATRFKPRERNEKFRAVAASPLLDRITSLELFDCGMDDEGAALLAKSPHLVRLNKLRLDRNQIGAEGTRALALSPHLRGLAKLDLSGNPLGPTGVTALASSSALAGLAELDLGSAEIGDAGVSALAGWKLLKNLRTLNLTNNGITARGAGTLAACPRVRRLEKLDLSSNAIHNQGATALAASTQLAGLTVLNLRGNEITDTAVRALAGSTILAKLTQLDLAQNEITDQGAKALAKSPHLQRINHLDLFMTRVGDPGKKALKARFDKRAFVDYDD